MLGKIEGKRKRGRQRTRYVNCIICWKFSAVGRRQQNKGIGNHCEIDAILNIIIREDFMEEVTFA